MSVLQFGVWLSVPMQPFQRFFSCGWCSRTCTVVDDFPRERFLQLQRTSVTSDFKRDAHAVGARELERVRAYYEEREAAQERAEHSMRHMAGAGNIGFDNADAANTQADIGRPAVAANTLAASSHELEVFARANTDASTCANPDLDGAHRVDTNFRANTDARTIASYEPRSDHDEGCLWSYTVGEVLR